MISQGIFDIIAERMNNVNDEVINKHNMVFEVGGCTHQTSKWGISLTAMTLHDEVVVCVTVGDVVGPDTDRTVSE